jgi:predicted RNA-binding protein
MCFVNTISIFYTGLTHYLTQENIFTHSLFRNKDNYLLFFRTKGNEFTIFNQFILPLKFYCKRILKPGDLMAMIRRIMFLDG